jgi:hypothetical protein
MIFFNDKDSTFKGISKSSETYLQTRMYLLDLNLGSTPFEIVPLLSGTSIPAPLSQLVCVLEVLFSKRTENILRSPLDLLHSVKAATL